MKVLTILARHLLMAAMVAGCAGRVEPGPPSRGSVRFWLGGDVHLGDGKESVLEPLSPLTNGTPGIVNLEGAVADSVPPGPPRRLHNAPSSLIHLVRAGVWVAGVANNHRGDAGEGSLDATRRALAGAGLLAAGDGPDPAVLDVEGMKVAVTAHDLTRGVPEGLAGELRAARRRGDLLVATFHVTRPPSYLPAPELEQAVEAALAAGARVVAAHGSHMVGRVERRGDAVVALGLGNVAFACDCTGESDAILLEVSIDRSGRLEAAVIPIEAGLKGTPARPAARPEGIYDLLDALGSSPLARHGDRATF